MKPDWKDAPEWARYLAMDKDGSWYWYEEEPLKLTHIWADTDGQCSYATFHPPHWKSSLEQRPETSGTTSGGTP